MRLGRRGTVLLGLFLIGCALRVGTVLAALRTNYNPYVRIRQWGDMAAYVSIAVSVVKGEGFSEHYGPVIADFFQDPRHVQPTRPPVPSARKPVGYPLFLALLFRLFGFHLVPVLIVQALLSAGSTWLVYLIARQVGEPEFAMIPYAISVLYYPFWYKAALLFVETLLIFLTLVALYGLIRWLIRPTVRGAWWTGISVGLSYLVKAVMLPFIPFYLVAAYRHHRRLGLARASVIGAAALAGAVVLVLAPLALRNYRQSGRLLITPTHAGYQLLQIHNPYNPTFESYSMPGFGNEAYDGLRRAKEEAQPALPPGTPPVLAEILVDNAYRRAALAFIAADPGHFMRSLGHSFWNVWRIDYPKATSLRKASNLVCYALLVPFFFMGIGIAWARRNIPALCLAGFVAYFVVFHAIMAAQLRYRITAMPAFFIVASLGLAWSWERCAQRQRVAAQARAG